MKRLVLVCAAAACGGPTKPAPLPVESPVAMKPPVDPVPDTKPVPPAMPGPAKDYPPTKRDDIVETIHGVQVHDPYRWLEDPSKQDVKDWMTAQDDYARAKLAALPGRDELAKRLTEVFYYDAVSAPTHRKGRFFYTR